jgi:hypothetical protein
MTHLRRAADLAVRRVRARAAGLTWPIWGSIALMAGLLCFFWRSEGTLTNIVFTTATTFALIAILLLVSRRALFATSLVALFITTLVWAASVKNATMNMVVHAYDLFFYLSSWSTIAFLWSEQRVLVVSFVVALATMLIGGAVVYRLDTSRIRRRPVAAALAGCIAVASVAVSLKEERRHMQFHFANLYVSSFYASWAETLGTLWHGAMMETLPSATASTSEPLRIPAACEPGEKPPHIVLIHQESIVQPSLFPTLTYDKSVDAMFKSQDGHTRKLRVETYGGASWLTEFSILAGVSTKTFGGMRQFVQTFMVNRLRDTLPQVLQRCGYRNVVFYPMLRNFVSNDRFYSSIGLSEIFDLKAQGAKTAQERDRFYYANALAEMQRHVSSSDKPMFTYIQTMSAHWPYDVTWQPSEVVPGGGPGTNPEMHEYLRRLSLAKRDYDFLIAELRRRFPEQRILVVHYGDHHPSASRTLLGYDESADFEGFKVDPNSTAFKTYFAVDGINYRVPALSNHAATDVAYLGTIILKSAGLPLSDAHRERLRLMELCEGRYHSCAQRTQILAFQRRLIDSGIIMAR